MTVDNQLKEIMAAVLGINEASIIPDASNETLAAWDSIRHMQLILALEDEFGLEFTDKEIGEVTSYQALSGVLTAKLEAGT